MLNYTDISKVFGAEQAFWSQMSVKKASFKGMEVFITKIPEPFLNLLMLTPEINTQDFRRHILDAEEFFLKAQIPWTLWTNPHAKINEELIEEFNFSLLEEVPTFCFDLKNNEILEPDAVLKIKNVEIREVLNSADLNDWYEPMIEGFKVPNNNTDFLQLTAKIPYGPSQSFKHYIAYQEDNPIASATLFLHQDYSMIHNIATKNIFLRKGLGSAMTLYLLRQARKYECHFSILESSVDGVALYQKLGFQELYVNNVYQQNLL